MRNKKAVTMMLRNGNSQLAFTMFQKTLGIACDELKRKGKYDVAEDFIKEFNKVIHKYREYLSIETVGEPFPNESGGYTIEANISYRY